MCVGAQRPDMLEAGACVCRSPEDRLSLEAGVLASHGGQHKKVTVTKEGSAPWLSCRTAEQLSRPSRQRVAHKSTHMTQPNSSCRHI